jgi:hypothetical protein
MTAYVAVCWPRVHWGGLGDCLAWASAQTGTAKVLRARAGEPSAVVVGELTADGWRPIRDGRTVPLSKLHRHG